jgi:uncharacterized OsmC-like protein
VVWVSSDYLVRIAMATTAIVSSWSAGQHPGQEQGAPSPPQIGCASKVSCVVIQLVAIEHSNEISWRGGAAGLMYAAERVDLFRR